VEYILLVFSVRGLPQVDDTLKKRELKFRNKYLRGANHYFLISSRGHEVSKISILGDCFMY
jgi:hypothetical protein